MPALRRSVVAAVCLGAVVIASAAVGEIASTRSAAAADATVADLVALSAESNGALMRGDIERYRSLIAYTDDFVLMSPFGGEPSRAAEYTPERMAAMGRFFKNGSFDQEVVQTYRSADMVVLALIERQRVEVGGLPMQDWPLRVTLVYQRDGTRWRLAHRHADPLVAGIDLEHAAALARGDRGSAQ